MFSYVRGAKGAKKLFESRINPMIDNTPSIFIVLAYANLFECLTVLLDDTDNFKMDSKVINRNMLLHGMSRHPVRKIDCIKLFLLLYNLIEAIEIYLRAGFCQHRRGDSKGI